MPVGCKQILQYLYKRLEHHLVFVLAGGPGVGLPWIPRDGYKLFVGLMKTGGAGREVVKIFWKDSF